jgi:CRP-like cAMP-binding protein
MSNSLPRPSSAGLERFRRIIESQISLPDAEWDYAVPFLAGRTFAKEEYLVHAGETADNFYFLVSGLVRFYYSTEDGKEFNKHFAMENGFAGSFQSQVLGEPCGFFLQAMERTETIVLPNSQLRELYGRHSCWERLGRRNAENLVLIKEAREKEFLLDSLEVRYRRFL